MHRTLFLLSAACAGIIAAGAQAAQDTHTKNSAKPDTERCYGIARAGKNDCVSATGMHACAGQTLKDGDPGDWVTLPKGECTKRSGSTGEPKG